MPTIYIIAGANGAGKTTAAYNLLPEVNDWYLYDNSGRSYMLVARSIDKEIEIFNKVISK